MKTRNPMPSRPRLCALALTLALLAGCAGPPVVTWTPPDPSKGDGGASLDHAHAYAAAARSAYQDAIARQVNGQATLGTALLGTGALAAALALGGVHSSAVIGTTFIAGAGYGYGQWSYDRRRLLILQAGVEAINCANRAVAPFDTDVKALAGAVGTVASARDAVTTARAAVGQAMRAFAQADLERIAAQADLDAADGVLAAAGTAQNGAQGYLNAARRAGGELILAVDRIDATVVRATLDTLPDLSAVPKIVAGLAGMAGMFVPPAGSDKQLRDLVLNSLGNSNSTPPTEAQRQNVAIAALKTQREALDKAVGALALPSREHFSLTCAPAAGAGPPERRPEWCEQQHPQAAQPAPRPARRAGGWGTRRHRHPKPAP